MLYVFFSEDSVVNPYCASDISMELFSPKYA